MQPLEATDPKQIGGVRLISRLGSGGFGIVYLGVSAINTWVAVKVLNLAYIDIETRRRLAREARASRLVHSEFVSSIEEVSISGTPPFLISEYVPGPTLAELRNQFRPLNDLEFTALAAGLAQALNDMHQKGVIHRDIKPSNVIMGEVGPVVVDFGIARTSADSLITRQGIVAGTPNWMSPEQVSGNQISAATDVWSWGSCLEWVARTHGIDLSQHSALSALIQRTKLEDPLSRPLADEIIDAITSGVETSRFIEEPWGPLRTIAAEQRLQLPTTASTPLDFIPLTKLYGDSSPLLTTRVAPPSTVDDPPTHNLQQATQVAPQQLPYRRKSGTWLVIALSVGVLLALGAGVAVGLALWSPQTVSPTTVSAPTPTVTISATIESDTVEQDSDSVPETPQGGEQELVNQLAIGMNAQDWAFVNSLCYPTQTCEVQFTDFFASRYSRGQWVETSFGRLNSCRFNVPYNMERGCIDSSKWVGSVFFTCFKDGKYGYQEEITSFTFTYANGFPQIERFDPVALVNRADECY